MSNAIMVIALILIGATFREKLVFHNRGVNKAVTCLLRRRAVLGRLPLLDFTPPPHTSIIARFVMLVFLSLGLL